MFGQGLHLAEVTSRFSPDSSHERSSYPSHPASAEPYCHTDVVQPAFRHQRRVMAAMENALLSASKAVSYNQSFLRNFSDLHHISKSGESSFHIQSIHRSPISMSDSSIVFRLPRLPIGRERTATPACLHLLKRLAESHSRKDVCINDIKPMKRSTCNLPLRVIT